MSDKRDKCDKHFPPGDKTVKSLLFVFLILTAATADAGIFSRFRSRSVNVSKSYTCSGGRCTLNVSKQVDLNGYQKTVIVNRGSNPPQPPEVEAPKKVNVTIDVNVNPYE